MVCHLRFIRGLAKCTIVNRIFTHMERSTVRLYLAYDSFRFKKLDTKKQLFHFFQSKSIKRLNSFTVSWSPKFNFFCLFGSLVLSSSIREFCFPFILTLHFPEVYGLSIEESMSAEACNIGSASRMVPYFVSFSPAAVAGNLLQHWSRVKLV